MLDALNPLTALCRKYPALEAQVIWADGIEWQPQEDDEAGLDGEEIAFYAEGMVQEGYSCAWQILGIGAPEFVRLFFWIGAMPPLPSDPDLISQGSTAG
jgi:hypothetical protein